MLKHQPRSRYSDNVKFFPIFNAIKFTLKKKKNNNKVNAVFVSFLGIYSKSLLT